MTSTWSVSPAACAKAWEPLLEVLGVHAVQARPLELDPPDQVGPVARVQRDPRAGLVHRDHRVAVAPDATPIAESLAHRLADRNSGVLDGVVQRHVDIALRVAVDIDQAVARELLQHVVEEADSRGDPRAPAPVEIDRDGNARLLGNPLDAGRARGLAHA